jgi:hypothetical protein
MKHRNTYTLPGGENMQRRNLGRAMRCLVAVGVLVSSLALFACGGDDDEGGQIQNVNSNVAATTSTVPSVVGREITIANGQVFGGPLGSNPATLIFTTPTTFTLRQGGVTLQGNVSYGSNAQCTFVVTQGGAGALAIATCNLVVVANNAVCGTGQVPGIITLVLNNGAGITVSSNSLNATVFLDSSCELFVVNPVTGVSVDMGIQL